MKKVIKEDNETVSLKNVSGTRYYGVLFNKHKGFITRQDYGLGNYKICATSNITIGNSYIITDLNLKDLIEKAITKGEVFEFETSKELFKWLSE